MNTDNLRDFARDLFTLRTVWIDKGCGRWAVKKRLHPLLRGIFCTAGVVLAATVYAGLTTPHAVEADPAAGTAQSPVMVTASLPAPETLPITEEPPAPPVQTEQQHIIIPLKTRASTIQLPSEVNPNIDRIIVETEPSPAPSAPAGSGKYSIVVNKAAYTLTLYRGSEPVKTYSVAVGRNKGDKQKRGDNRTPVGDFKIVSIENASHWSHDFRDGKGRIAGAYGPWFLRLDANGWKGIGIHGTHDPDSRGTNATEGCIRLSNEDIAELKQYAYLNMPVLIREN